MVLDEHDGNFFEAVIDTVFENNRVGINVAQKCKNGTGQRGTRATKSVNLDGENNATISFQDSLLFGSKVGIDKSSVRCWMYGSGYAAGVVSDTDPLSVVVTVGGASLAGTSSTAMATCTVDQSTRACAAH